jgi:hypothetical protein
LRRGSVFKNFILGWGDEHLLSMHEALGSILSIAKQEAKQTIKRRLKKWSHRRMN